MTYLNALFEGLAFGSVYALVAVSLNILFRPTNVINLAQGGFVMVGALVGAKLAADAGLPWIAAAVVAMAAVAAVSLVLERVAVTPVLERSATAAGWVISTLGFSLIVDNVVGRVFGAASIGMNAPSPLSTSPIGSGEFSVSSYQLGLICFVILLVLGVEALYRSRTGRAVLAVAEDREAAELRGIDPKRLAMWSFAIGGALAGLAGVLAAPLIFASTTIGLSMLVRGFVAAAIGGIGSNRGALLGGYLVGLTQAFGARLVAPGYADALILLLLLIVLTAKPAGLFGQVEARHV